MEDRESLKKMLNDYYVFTTEEQKKELETITDSYIDILRRSILKKGEKDASLKEGECILTEEQQEKHIKLKKEKIREDLESKIEKYLRDNGFGLSFIDQEMSSKRITDQLEINSDLNIILESLENEDLDIDIDYFVLHKGYLINFYSIKRQFSIEIGIENEYYRRKC